MGLIKDAITIEALLVHHARESAKHLRKVNKLAAEIFRSYGMEVELGDTIIYYGKVSKAQTAAFLRKAGELSAAYENHRNAEAELKRLSQVAVQLQRKIRVCIGYVLLEFERRIAEIPEEVRAKIHDQLKRIFVLTGITFWDDLNVIVGELQILDRYLFILSEVPAEVIPPPALVPTRRTRARRVTRK